MQKVNIFNVKFKKVYEKLERDIEGTSRKGQDIRVCQHAPTKTEDLRRRCSRPNLLGLNLSVENSK